MCTYIYHIGGLPVQSPHSPGHTSGFTVQSLGLNVDEVLPGNGWLQYAWSGCLHGAVSKHKKKWIKNCIACNKTRIYEAGFYCIYSKQKLLLPNQLDAIWCCLGPLNTMGVNTCILTEYLSSSHSTPLKTRQTATAMYFQCYKVNLHWLYNVPHWYF